VNHPELKLSISRQSLYLRLFPVTLPSAVILAAISGFAIRVDFSLGLDNLLWVLYAGVISGFIPFCVVLGVVFLVADLVYGSLRGWYVGASCVILCIAVVVGYQFGVGLDF